MKFYKEDGKESIGADSPKEVSLEFVLKEVDNHPIEEGNFIGLINDKGETIQFVRFERDEWLIDVPVLEGDTYAFFQDEDLNTEKVKEIVQRFFEGTDWTSLCNLMRIQEDEITKNHTGTAIESVDNLNLMYKEIVAYIKSSGLHIFPAVSGEYSLAEELPNVMIWDSEVSDWKAFIDIAKDEGIKTIIVEIIKGKDEKHAEDIGSITLAWIKDGMIYAFEKFTEWLVGFPVRKEITPSIGTRSGREEQISEEALEELRSKDENQLVNELLALFTKEFPDLDRRNSRSINALFWEQKGIQRWLLEPELHLKVDKVDALFRQKLEQEHSKRLKEQIEKERKLLPKLVEECLDWAEKEQFKRITKSNLNYFLVEKGSEVTTTSRDLLYHQVNLKLKSK